MPPQSRSQRRRQAVRQQGRANATQNAGAVSRAPSASSTTSAPVAPESASARPARQTRRVLSRPAPEPVDYSKDYDAVRRDLRWIVLWTVLLFGGMIALKFSGLV